MKSLIFRILIAAPISLVLLVAPFFLSFFIRDRFGIEIHSAVPIAIGLGLAFTAFFSIAGKQMKQVDSEWHQRRSKNH